MLYFNTKQAKCLTSKGWVVGRPFRRIVFPSAFDGFFDEVLTLWLLFGHFAELLHLRILLLHFHLSWCFVWFGALLVLHGHVNAAIFPVVR